MDFTIYILKELKAKLERQTVFYSEQVGNGLLIASEIVEDYIEQLEGEE
jgi:hypothetical protein